MKYQDSTAKMAAPHTGGSPRTARPTKKAAPQNGGVINRQESYQQAPASSPKKAEGKRDLPPCTPYREKGKGKETQTGFPKETVFRAGACACEREEARTGAMHGGHAGRVTLPGRVAAALDADLDTAARMFHGTAEDRRIWASIAWRVGVEAFHFALMDKLAEDASDGTARKPAAAFQAFLNARFPKGGAA